ncbi:ferritin-like domain-containing protein [Catalinimonas niigatensis]|uniref:ferritin-like domain-containing protein n=1 Tax=Catalinimonas niigatensis TaxID=1397264 RepID=UPI002665A5A2|nr:PA2169 family four-helix-bundle protein [Catalinimonas niigatensis]WPP52046.1 PA2169 family four-helix-bundle protein [Catalinimonas niigatensis]
MSNDERNHKITNTINELITVCAEGERGYKNASERVDEKEFKTILYRLSQQRALFRSELENELIKDFGQEAKGDDSLLSKFHRGWMDFKAGLKGNDSKAVFDECIRGENHAIDKYMDALKKNLPNYLEERVKNQLEMIKGTLIQLREFESEVTHN